MGCKKYNHAHPWPRSGVLTIERCETRCNFCSGSAATKDWKYAWFLRRHVRSVHIKNGEFKNLEVSEEWDDQRAARAHEEAAKRQREDGTSTTDATDSEAPHRNRRRRKLMSRRDIFAQIARKKKPDTAPQPPLASPKAPVAQMVAPKSPSPDVTPPTTTVKVPSQPPPTYYDSETSSQYTRRMFDKLELLNNLEQTAKQDIAFASRMTTLMQRTPDWQHDLVTTREAEIQAIQVSRRALMARCHIPVRPRDYDLLEALLLPVTLSNVICPQDTMPSSSAVPSITVNSMVTGFSSNI